MREYTDSFLKAFKWARASYEHSLGLVTTDTVSVDAASLIRPTAESTYSPLVEIESSVDWNTNTIKQMSDLAGLYTSIDQCDDYYKGLYATISARLEESSNRLDELESKLKTSRSTLSNAGNTINTVRGGSLDQVELDPKFYSTYGLLNTDPIEGVYCLSDTGVFSTIRSLNGFAGKAFIEKSLFPIVEETGQLTDVTDGSSSTYWFGSVYSPAPLRTSSADTSWLSSGYRQGAGLLLTYYLERPVLASEIYVDPIVTEPLDLVSVSWTPTLFQSAITNGSFVSGGVGWTLSSTHSSFLSGAGIDSTLGACILNTGFLYRNVILSSGYSLSSSAVLNTSASAYLSSNRVQLNYYMKSTGLKAGARIVWYDNSGDVLSYDEREDFGSNFFNQYTLVSYAPTQAYSFDIRLGSFNTPYPPALNPVAATDSASALFDNVSLFVGECKWDCNRVVTKPQTLTLPQRATTARISYTLVQRNPRKKILSLNTASTNVEGFIGAKDVSAELALASSQRLQDATNKGSGNVVFSYNFGLRELDVRYKEYIPRGAIISKPVKTPLEIRKMWLTVDLSGDYNTGMSFYIYPYADNLNYLVTANPFALYSVPDSRKNFYNSDGSVYEIFTNEEINAGYDQRASNVIAVDPVQRTDLFDGTDRDGNVQLPLPLHVRRVELERVSAFLKSYGIHDYHFDPNSSIVYGVTGNSRDILMAYQLNQDAVKTVQASDIVSTQGYSPVKVTVRTDKFTAYPDQYGKPSSNIIYPVKGEVLVGTDVEITKTNTRSDYIGFQAWLNITKVSDLYSMGLMDTGSSLPFDSPGADVTLQQAISTSRGYDKNRLLNWYNSLLANGRIPKDTSGSITQTSTTKKDTAYKTKFSPLLSGATGTFLRLYWHNYSTLEDTTLPKNSYAIEPLTGTVTLNTVAPTASSILMADYMFLVKPLSKGVNALDEENLIRQSTGQDTVITRNVTDYSTGKTPELRPPNLDILDREYYPVIEYYVTPESKIKFAREFFKFGDQPAQVTISYDTLNINPRFAAYVLRDSAVTKSPRIKSLSFGYRAGSASHSNPQNEL